MRTKGGSVAWRAGILIGAAALLSASVSWTPAQTPGQPAAARLPLPVLAPVLADLGPLAQELRQRLVALHPSKAGAASSPQVVRDPLGFPPLPVPETDARLPVERVGVPEPPRTALPSAPELTLVGIAETRDGEAVVRTAIITGAGDDLHLIRERDVLVGRYAVRVIEEGAVLLDEVSRGGVRRLTMTGFSGPGSPIVE